MATAAIDPREMEELFSIVESGEAGGGTHDDPWPIWADLLARGPVHKGSIAECMGLPVERNGGGMYHPDRTYYSVFGFNAVSEVFTRKDDFFSEAYVDMGTSQEFGDTILNMDGPPHRMFRDLLQKFFQPGPAEAWWRGKVIDPLVEEILAGLEGESSVDINSRFFARLPLHTMTGGFGLSFAQGLELRRNMLKSLHGTSLDDRIAGREGAGKVIADAIQAKRANPQDDMISHLTQAEVTEEDGSKRSLTDDEIVSYCRLIVFAGGETTWRQMGNALYALLNHPDQLAEVIADRSLLGPAVLESVRWHPDPLFPRKVKRDCVLAGVDLPAGAHLHLCLGAANRDPVRWERPDTFDIHRPFQRSVAFAAGAHSCLGQHVARQEIAAALGALFERFPNIRWDRSRPPAKLTGSLVQRGPGALHVRLD